MFRFEGNMLLSKSWVNRVQIIQHYSKKKLNLDLNNISEDVTYLNQAIEQLNLQNKFNLGLGGTSFRFFSFLVSRMSGGYHVAAHARLLERPQKPILQILEQLGVQASLTKNSLKLNSSGWKLPQVINCAGQESTQFISGVLLNAWDLADDLKIQISKPILSEPYLEMTIQLLAATGMQIQVFEANDFKTLIVEANSCVRDLEKLKPEPDISSFFSLAAAAVVGGEVEIKNWSSESTQPDMAFLKIFKAMNIDFKIEGSVFKINQQQSWNGIHCNLKDSPDLFPCLAVLAALSGQESVLFGAHQLKIKESDRIAKSYELLTGLGFRCHELQDGLEIKGFKPHVNNEHFIFDPDHDHRMAMAASLLQLAGYQIEIKSREVVKKSYPNYWRDIGL